MRCAVVGRGVRVCGDGAGWAARVQGSGRGDSVVAVAMPTPTRRVRLQLIKAL